MSNEDSPDLKNRLAQLQVPPRLRWSERMDEVLGGSSSENKEGYPIISEISFYTVLDEIPHLFTNGYLNLVALNNYKEITPNIMGLSFHEKASLERSIKVLENIVYTASITAPSDLWALRWVLRTHKRLNLTDPFLTGEWIDLEILCKERQLDMKYFLYDLELFYSRGWVELDRTKMQARLIPLPHIRDLYQNLSADTTFDEIDWVQLLSEFFISGSEEQREKIDKFFAVKAAPSRKPDWSPDLFEVELGSRVLLLVLAIRSLDLNRQLKKDHVIVETLPQLSASLFATLTFSGLVDTQLKVTALGERVFARGPGPFGIIYAYLSYMQNHEKLLKGNKEGIWVARGKNVAASQDANSKSFLKIIKSLSQFQEDHQHKINLFIEHAVGEGEATRLHHKQHPEAQVQYVGADLEDAAIDKAVKGQKKGKLPKNMKFVRNADIGKPDVLFKALEKLGVSTDKAVMVVGNGFHEVRDQTNEKMVQVFKKYCEAGLILIFTEESGLTSEDLIETGWNTYHAGFRYVHEISGQGLRPAIPREGNNQNLFSWQKCLSLGGYLMLPKYTSRSRSIFPHPKPDGYNPSISVNYFCIPQSLAKKLNILKDSDI